MQATLGNGVDKPAQSATQLAAMRRELLEQERQAVIKERELLTLRYRVQKRIGAPAERLAELEHALEQDELAMLELEAIAREWGMLE
jgi:hypothetical protein